MNAMQFVELLNQRCNEQLNFLCTQLALQSGADFLEQNHILNTIHILGNVQFDFDASTQKLCCIFNSGADYTMRHPYPAAAEIIAAYPTSHGVGELHISAAQIELRPGRHIPMTR